MEKLEWLQAFAEPEQPETGAAAPTPEQQERLAAISPEGTQALTQEQREAAMRQGYARLKAQFAAVQAVYPQAELSRALEDPRFLRLVTHGVDAKSAYELTHLRELTAEAMAYLYEYKAYKALRGNSFIDRIAQEIAGWEIVT